MNEKRRHLLIVMAVIVSICTVSFGIGVLAPMESLSASMDSSAGDSNEATGANAGSASTGGTGGSGGSDTNRGQATETRPPPFSVDIESVDSCGQTCRDVTATLENNQEQQATGVSVDTTIFAGESTNGDIVWEGSQDVGSLPAGASETDTQRVDLGFMAAAKVQGSGGEITILLVVESDQRSVRFVEHRDVT